MDQWFNDRCAQLLDDLNQVPHNDDEDELRIKLIRVAMRDSSLEMFRRAAANSRKAIDEDDDDLCSDSIQKVEQTLLQDIAPEITEMTNTMLDLNDIPGVPEAMAKAEEKFRQEKTEIDDEPKEPVKSKPLSAGDLNLDKFLKKPSDEKAEAGESKPDDEAQTEEPVKPSPKSRIKINSSILRRD